MATASLSELAQKAKFAISLKKGFFLKFYIGV